MKHDMEQKQMHETDGCDGPNTNEEEEKEVVFGNEKPANS